MVFHSRRTAFIFCVLCFALGCCLANRGNADAGSKKIHLPGILKEFGWEPEREISGTVSYNGVGLEGVVINDKTVQVAVTDSQGYYKIKATHFSYTVTPQKTCYQFTPQTIDIPANQYNQENQNFWISKKP